MYINTYVCINLGVAIDIGGHMGDSTIPIGIYMNVYMNIMCI
jgi:hypothetical protein